MVVACAVALSRAGPGAAGGREMFFAVVQLAGTIAGGIVGNAMSSHARGKTKKLHLARERATLPITPQKNGPADG